MNRRRFLQLTGAAATAAAAGCVSSAQEAPADQPSTPASAEVNPIDMSGSFSDGGAFEDSFELPDEGEGPAVANISMLVQLRPAGADEETYGAGQVTITNETTGEELYADEVIPSYQPGDSRLYEAVDTGEVWGDTIAVRFEPSHADDLEWRFSYGATVVSQ